MAQPRRRRCPRSPPRPQGSGNSAMSLRAALVLIAAMALLATTRVGATAATPPQKATVASVSGYALPTIVCGAGGIVGDVAGGVVGDAVSSGADAVASSALSGIVSWAADGAAWLVEQVAKQIDRSSRPALGSDW